MFLLLSAALLAQGPEPAELQLYQFHRDPNITSVVGFIGISLPQLTYAPDSADTQRAQYGIGVQIKDSTGNVLHREAWTETVITPRGSLPATAHAVENLAVDLQPGRYDLEVVVRDLVGRDSVKLTRVLRADGRPVGIGDMILATDIRREQPGEALPRGTIRRNGLLLAPNFAATVTGVEGALTLYSEVYPSRARAEQTATVSIMLSGGPMGFNQERPVAQRRYPFGGGVEVLRVPVSGLAPGDYRLGLKIAYADTTLVVEREFHILPPPTREGSNLFVDMTEAQLDTLFLTARYIADPDEERLYPTLSVEAKRRFLQRFWARRDPTPGGVNEFYEGYRERVAYANTHFGTRTQRGWSTARGRIYIVYGPPAERFTQPVVGRSGTDRPFEIWKYTGGRNPKFVFFDQAAFGNFQLIYSSEPNEPTLPNWRSFFDRETLAMIDNF